MEKYVMNHLVKEDLYQIHNLKLCCIKNFKIRNIINVLQVLHLVSKYRIFFF